MLLRRAAAVAGRPLLLRSYAQSAAAIVPLEEEPAELPTLAYLDGFPQPDPKHDETILAIPRSGSGTSVSVKERKAGRVPAIVFEQEDGQHGGNKRLISVRTNQIRKLVNHLGRSFFLSRLFELEVREGGFDDDGEEGSRVVVERVRVLPRKNAYQCHSLLGLDRFIRSDDNECFTVCSIRTILHLHSATDAPLNVTFLRAPSCALLKVEVPLVYRGEDVSPGLRKGSSLNTIKRTAKLLCPADIIPPYIDVDLSELDVGQKLVMGDLKVHPSLKLLQSKDEPVCKIMGARVSDQRRK